MRGMKLSADNQAYINVWKQKIDAGVSGVSDLTAEITRVSRKQAEADRAVAHPDHTIPFSQQKQVRAANEKRAAELADLVDALTNLKTYAKQHRKRTTKMLATKAGVLQAALAMLRAAQKLDSDSWRKGWATAKADLDQLKAIIQTVKLPDSHLLSGLHGTLSEMWRYAGWAESTIKDRQDLAYEKMTRILLKCAKSFYQIAKLQYKQGLVKSTEKRVIKLAKSHGAKSIRAQKAGNPPDYLDNLSYVIQYGSRAFELLKSLGTGWNYRDWQDTMHLLEPELNLLRNVSFRNAPKLQTGLAMMLDYYEKTFRAVQGQMRYHGPSDDTKFRTYALQNMQRLVSVAKQLKSAIASGKWKARKAVPGSVFAAQSNYLHGVGALDRLVKIMQVNNVTNGGKKKPFILMNKWTQIYNYPRSASQLVDQALRLTQKQAIAQDDAEYNALARQVTQILSRLSNAMEKAFEAVAQSAQRSKAKASKVAPDKHPQVQYLRKALPFGQRALAIVKSARNSADLLSVEPQLRMVIRLVSMAQGTSPEGGVGAGIYADQLRNAYDMAAAVIQRFKDSKAPYDVSMSKEQRQAAALLDSAVEHHQKVLSQLMRAGNVW